VPSTGGGYDAGILAAHVPSAMVAPAGGMVVEGVWDGRVWLGDRIERVDPVRARAGGMIVDGPDGRAARVTALVQHGGG